MKVKETLLDGDQCRYEQRYKVRLGNYTLSGMVRRPVAIEPKDGTVAFADNGPRLGIVPRQAIGFFKDGKWTNGKGRALPFEVTHWTACEDSRGSVDGAQ